MPREKSPYEFLRGRRERTPGWLLREALAAARATLGGDRAVALVPAAHGWQRTCVSAEAPEPHAADLGPWVADAIERGLAGRILAIPDLGAAGPLGEALGGPAARGAALVAPLAGQDGPGGVLAVLGESPSAFPPGALRSLDLLAAGLSLALANRRLALDVRRLAVTDDVTQVHNCRFLKTALRREIQRALRYQESLSLLMIDVDNLKGYNDRHGHLRGSHLLRRLAARLQASVRACDVVAKYGGDEFTVILPQTPLAGAAPAAERLRRAIAGASFPFAAAGEITISIGVATFPEDGVHEAALLAAADRALYQAKRGGRNRVALAAARAAA